MNDYKNILLAWASASTSVFAAFEAKTVITILSAIVLPIVFFAVGKTIDVLLQIHISGKEASRREKNDEQ